MYYYHTIKNTSTSIKHVGYYHIGTVTNTSSTRKTKFPSYMVEKINVISFNHYCHNSMVTIQSYFHSFPSPKVNFLFLIHHCFRIDFGQKSQDPPSLESGKTKLHLFSDDIIYSYLNN